MRKILYITIGCISLGLGIISVILPILPTVPFVLLAAFCFAKSSERLDGWFKNTKLYEENNIKSGMTKRAKLRIMCSVTLLMNIGFIMMGLKGIVVGNIVLLIVWSKDSMRRVLNYLLAISFVLTIMVPNTGIIVHKLASTLFLVLALIHVFLYRKRLDL